MDVIPDTPSHSHSAAAPEETKVAATLADTTAVRGRNTLKVSHAAPDETKATRSATAAARKANKV